MVETSVSDRRRSVEVRVKLSPVLSERFSAIAERRGLPPATLAAVALGEYVEAQETRLQLQRMATVDVSKRAVDLISSPDSVAALAKSIFSDPAMLSALASSAGEEG